MSRKIYFNNPGKKCKKCGFLQYGDSNSCSYCGNFFDDHLENKLKEIEDKNENSQKILMDKIDKL